MKSPIEIRLPGMDLSEEERKKWYAFYQDKYDSASEKWEKDIWFFLLKWTDKEESIELRTSGSTGDPKIIRVKKSTLLFSAKQTAEYFGFAKKEKWLLCLPAGFIGGQMILVRAMQVDAAVHAVEPKIDLKDVDGDFDFASMIPMQVEKYLDAESGLKIRRILIGGSGIPVSLEKRLLLESETAFYASYGMTETVSHIALRKVNGENHSDHFSPFKNILLGTDERNCLTVYHKSYSENVLITNDLVEFDSEGRFKVIGRVDNIINSGGMKIIPEELEERISGILSQRIMVIGIPDEKTGEKPVLLIEGKEFDKSTLMILKNHLNENIEKNKSPKEIGFIERMQETENGKLDRRKTKEVYLKKRRSSL